MKTIQTMFNDAVSKTWQQGKPCATHDENFGFTCRYRNHEGLRCAVGQLIPDELYSLDLESLGASNEDILGVLLQAGYDVQEYDGAMLQALQHAHDYWALHQENAKPEMNEDTTTLERDFRVLLRDNPPFRDYWLQATALIAANAGLETWTPECETSAA